MGKVSGSRLHLFLICIFTATTCGCGVSDHMKSMDDNMTRMANEIQYDRTAINTLSDQSKSLADYAKSCTDYAKMMSQYAQYMSEDSKAIADTLAAYQSQIKVIADSLAQLDGTALSVMKALTSQMKNATPDPNTPDFGDVFGTPAGASGASGATGTSSPTPPPTKDPHS